MLSRSRRRTEYENRVLTAKILCTAYIFIYTFSCATVINLSKDVVDIILFIILTGTTVLFLRKWTWEKIVGDHNRW